MSFKACDACEEFVVKKVIFPAYTEWKCRLMEGRGERSERDFLWMASRLFLDSISEDWLVITRPRLTAIGSGETYLCNASEVKGQVLRRCLACDELVYRCRCKNPRLQWTGRLAVETGRGINNGTFLKDVPPSGITVSDADWMLDYFHDVVYMTPRKKVLQATQAGPIRARLDATFHPQMGDGNASGWTFQRYAFRDEFNPIIIPIPKDIRPRFMELIRAKEAAEQERERQRRGSA